MTDLIPALRARLEFNENRERLFFNHNGFDNTRAQNDDKEGINPGVWLPVAAVKKYCKRLAPLHEMLLRVVEAAEKTERYGVPVIINGRMGSEPHPLDTALAALRKEVGS